MNARWFNWFDFWFAMDSFLFVPYELYTIQYSCYQSYIELNYLFAQYHKLFTHFDDFFFNVFYSGGTIIKNIVNLLMYFLA